LTVRLNSWLTGGRLPTAEGEEVDGR
jgi:hypothetical protein